MPRTIHVLGRGDFTQRRALLTQANLLLQESIENEEEEPQHDIKREPAVRDHEG